MAFNPIGSQHYRIIKYFGDSVISNNLNLLGLNKFKLWIGRKLAGSVGIGP